MEQLHAVIQSGGMGQRIRAAAGDTPKPLLEIGGVPMIERLLCQLTDAGLREITVILGRNGADIRARLLETARTLPTDLRLQFHVENQSLGNAGALGRIETRTAPVLFCFADLVTDLDFKTLAEVHRARRCDATLASHYEHHQLTLGELVTDGDRVSAYHEKPRKRFLICSGIAMFEPAAMRVARTLPAPFGLSDFVTAILRDGLTVTHWLHQAYWLDVNTPELLERARADERARRRRAGATGLIPVTEHP